MNESSHFQYGHGLSEREQRALVALRDVFEEVFLQPHQWTVTQTSDGTSILAARSLTAPYRCLAQLTLWDVENVARNRPDDVVRFVKKIQLGVFRCWHDECVHLERNDAA